MEKYKKGDRLAMKKHNGSLTIGTILKISKRTDKINSIEVVNSWNTNVHWTLLSYQCDNCLHHENFKSITKLGNEGETTIIDNTKEFNTTSPDNSKIKELNNRYN